MESYRKEQERIRKTLNLIEKMPTEFYKLFASKYRIYYQKFLTAIYEETSRSYSLLGLTEEECKAVMNENIADMALEWSEEQVDEEGEFLTRANMASICLRNLEEWGWLRRDYDETLNQYVVSFPEYSQLYVELFQKLFSEEGSKERESVLAVYSHLYTYSSDAEKNNEILKSALHTSTSLVQMLANMQEGMRGYFDDLSRQKSFLGIQEVLVREINNSDSKKYAILTTTDSFYRYKEAVNELIEKNLSENEVRRQEFEEKRQELGKDTPPYYRNERSIQLCEEAMDIICRIEREFDAIERRYNKLIEQKTIFANRAAARIRYILMEGVAEEDRTVAFVNLLNQSEKKEEILQKLASGMHLTERYKVVTERSLYQRKNAEKEKFVPQVVKESAEEQENLEGFVLKPLYTRKEIKDFRKKNEENGEFRVTERTVQTMEDLEKLFFVWQEATEWAQSDTIVEIEEELQAKGFRFSGLRIKEK